MRAMFFGWERERISYFCCAVKGWLLVGRRRGRKRAVNQLLLLCRGGWWVVVRRGGRERAVFLGWGEGANQLLLLLCRDEEVLVGRGRESAVHQPLLL